MPDHKTQVATLAFFFCLLAATGLMALAKQGTEQCTLINEGVGTVWLMLIVLLYFISYGATLLFDMSVKWIVVAMLVPTFALVTAQSWDAINCKFDHQSAFNRDLTLIDKQIRTGHRGTIHRVCFVPSWQAPQIRLSFTCRTDFFDQHQVGDKITLQIKPGFLGDEWIVHYE